MLRKKAKELDQLQAQANQSVAKVIEAMTTVADDPAVTDGRLRTALRDGAGVLTKLNEANAWNHRYLMKSHRRFFWLTAAYGALIGWQAMDAILRWWR